MASQNSPFYNEFLTDGNVVKALPYKIFPSPSHRSYISQNYQANSNLDQMSSAAADRSFLDQSHYGGPVIPKTFSYFKHQLPSSESQGGFPYPIYYAACPETNELIPYTVDPLSGIVHLYDPTMVQNYEPMVSNPTMNHHYEPMVNNPTMVHHYEAMGSNPTMVHHYGPMVDNPTMVRNYGPMVNNPTVVTRYEAMDSNPTMVRTDEPMVNNPTMVHYYEPRVNNPNMVHHYEAMGSNPTMVHNYEPMFDNPTVVGNYGPMVSNPTMVYNYEPMVTNPTMYGWWGQKEMIDQERRSHETYDPILCPTCDEVFVTPVHFDRHLPYCEARKRFESSKRDASFDRAVGQRQMRSDHETTVGRNSVGRDFDRAVGKRPMRTDNETTVGRNPVGRYFDRAVGKKPFP